MAIEHSFKIKTGDRYHVTMGILGMDSKMHEIPILFDTGNDVTLITRETAEGVMKLSPDLIDPSAGFPVYGITDKPVTALKIRNMIKLGPLRPVWIEMGIVAEKGAFAEDLIGRRCLLDNGLYSVTYDEDSVDIREKHMMFNAGSGSDFDLDKPGSEIKEAFRSTRNPTFYPLS